MYDDDFFDFDVFEEGEQIEYKWESGPGSRTFPGWHLGTMEEVDRTDPNYPWYVRVQDDQHDVDGGPCAWFSPNHVRKHEFIIQEEPELT